MSELDEQTWNSLLSSYESEYKDLCDTWKIVESKAQSTITLSSVLLAAAFAMAKDLPLSFTPIDKCALSLAVFALALSIYAAVWALRIRKIHGPPLGRSLHQLTDDLIKSGGDTNCTAYFKTVAHNWKETNMEISTNINDKSSIVDSAQACLAWAGSLFVFLTVSSVAS